MFRRIPITARLRETLLALAGFAALGGALFAIGDLFHAITQAEELYSVGMTGLSIEADLQDYTQESRRVFVYALTSRDPNVQLPYVDAARAADREVARLHKAFTAIRLNEAAGSQLHKLIADWKRYLVVRDDMIGLILEDRSDLALKREQAEGAPLFELCARHLQKLKRLLDTYAKDQLTAVQRTYYRCAAEVGFLLLTTTLLVASVRLLTRLRKRNQKLTESELLERQRSEILESISANLPLESVFSATLKMVEQRLPSSMCAISLLTDGQLFLACRTTLPQPLVSLIDGQRVATLRTAAAKAAARGEAVTCVRGTGIESIASAWSVPVCGSQRRILGTLDVYFTGETPASPEALRFVERAGQLAALAIEHRSVNDQLAFQAQHDSLTGLANRVMFQERLDRSITRAAITGERLAVLWIDLDRFKQVNDALGHQVGDALLQQVARQLHQCSAANGTVARIGGDEFVILLPDCDTAEFATEVASRILTRLNEPITASGHQVSVGASIGIALFPQHGEDRESLLRNADAAMYSVKFQGKNMYRIYDPGMDSISADTLEIDRQLRAALNERQFELVYQPQVGSGGRIECVEALLRWTSPTLGSVSPSRFIPIAEENGMIVPLGEWVLREACGQAARWHSRGFSHLRIAVNVSAHQFGRSDFAATVSKALRDSGLAPQFLELELTETAVMRRPDESVADFQALRRLGVRISIDDFGTGNSSLNYLLQLPVDALKIDRSFIDGLGRAGRDSLMLVRAIIGMAHGWRLQVVAEGIETQTQLNILQREGCDLNQGFLLYRPMSAGALNAVLTNQTVQASQQLQLATRDLIAIGTLAASEPAFDRRSSS